LKKIPVWCRLKSEGLTNAETLRKGGFEGEIVVVSGELSGEEAYDRTKLSKNLATPLDKLLLRTREQFWALGCHGRHTATPQSGGL
jgi:hypothetical protein